jgi:hypothetical protein
MWRYSQDLDQAGLVRLSDELDEFGYYSVLLTVHSRASDYLPKVASVLDKGHSVKYMLAIRPYLLSPQYYMMLLGGLQEIAKDRVMINWVHGTLGPKENFDAVLNVPDKMQRPDVRKQHMKDFLEALPKTNMFNPIEMPESLMSGGSKETLELAKEHSMYLGTGYDIFLNNYERYQEYKFEKIFLQVSLIVRDTDEEALQVKKSKVQENINIIAGSYKTVESKILELYEMGATDLLVSNAFPCDDDERYNIHRFVKSMKEKGLAI